MAKNLITTNISGSVKAPFSKAALDNLQANIPEISSAIIQGMLGSYNTNDVIVLYGFAITLTVSGTVATWTKGAVYYNGEIYQVSPGTLTKTSGVFLYSISDVPTSAAFSDGNPYPWIDVRTITIAAGTSGTGIADYGAASVKPLISIMNGEVNITPFSYQNAYADGGLTGSTGRYKRDSLGNVSLIGVLGSPPSVTSDIFATLPVSFRPTSPRLFAVGTYGSITSGGVFCLVAVNGVCKIQTANTSLIPASTNFTLDGISFNIND